MKLVLPEGDGHYSATELADMWKPEVDSDDDGMVNQRTVHCKSTDKVDAQTGRRVEGNRQGPVAGGDQKVQGGAACSVG